MRFQVNTNFERLLVDLLKIKLNNKDKDKKKKKKKKIADLP